MIIINTAAPNLNTTQMKTEIMMRRVARWMGQMPIRIGDQVIETQPFAVYLGGNDRNETDVR